MNKPEEEAFNLNSVYNLTLFPSHVAIGINKVLASTNHSEQKMAFVEAGERIIEHLFSFHLMQYLHFRNNFNDYPKCEPVERLFWNVYGKLSLGNMLQIARELNSHMQSTEIEEEIICKNFADLDSILSSFIKHRNNISHGRFNSESFKDLSLCFHSALKHSYFLTDWKIFVPVSYNSLTSSYSGFIFSGCGLPFYIENYTQNQTLDLQAVYCINRDNNAIFALTPFWQYSTGRESEQIVHNLYFVSIKNNNAILLDHANGVQAESKNIYNDYIKMIEQLSPDYSYQKNPYLQGHRLNILEKQTLLKVLNIHGDLETNLKMKIKKIIYDNDCPTTEICPFDYHDAPIYPIDDETFKLEITEEEDYPIEVNYEIQNDAFRKFSVNLEDMTFNDIRNLNMSCFEPMLFPDIINGLDEYYEIEIDQPTDVFFFSLELPDYIRFTSTKVEYLDGGSVKLTGYKNSKDVHIENTENGGQRACFKVKKPIVGKQIVFRFETEILQENIPETDCLLDNFRTGYEVYKFIKSNRSHNWKIDKKDNSINIRPSD